MIYFLLHFNDGSSGKDSWTEKKEQDFKAEMRKPQSKRKYTYGIEFSHVESIEVVSE